MTRTATHKAPPVGTDPDALRYRCSVCSTPVNLNAGRCPKCEARFAGVRCGHCEYVAPAEWFDHHTCPDCGVTPAPLPPDTDEALVCPACGRKTAASALGCRSCGWLDRTWITWWLLVMVVSLVAIPAFASGMSLGVWSLAFKWVGLLTAAAIGVGLTGSMMRARSWPMRRLLVVAVLLAYVVIVVDRMFPVVPG
jgi:hypothetical protein